MPKAQTIRRAKQDARAGKSPSTQAGEFVREEIESIRAGEHGARSPKQAIAIGLSKARRAGVKLPPPPKGRASSQIRRKARQDLRAGKKPHRPSPRRSRATLRALQKEDKTAASPAKLSQQARRAAQRRGPAARKRAAKKAARTRQHRSRAKSRPTRR